MNVDKPQIVTGTVPGIPTHIKRGSSRVSFTEDTNLMHVPGAQPIATTGTGRMSGVGTARELGQIFKFIGENKPKGR